MRLGRKPKMVDQEILDGFVLAYCPSCGKPTDQVFYPGEFVLVKSSGVRSYFGVITNIEKVDDEVVVVLRIGATESVKVPIGAISKVGK